MPNHAELRLGQKGARSRKAIIFVGLFVFVSAVPPLINAMGNPRLATLRGSDVAGLVALGFCLGFGLALLIIGLIFRGE